MGATAPGGFASNHIALGSYTYIYTHTHIYIYVSVEHSRKELRSGTTSHVCIYPWKTSSNPLTTTVRAQIDVATPPGCPELSIPNSIPPQNPLPKRVHPQTHPTPFQTMKKTPKIQIKPLFPSLTCVTAANLLLQPLSQPARCLRKHFKRDLFGRRTQGRLFFCLLELFFSQPSKQKAVGSRGCSHVSPNLLPISVGAGNSLLFPFSQAPGFPPYGCDANRAINPG